MPPRFKRDAVVVFGLTAALVFAKYNLARLPPRPFGLDPCDAVSVFAFLTIISIAVVSLVRAFRPYPKGSVFAAQSFYMIRLQQAFVLAVFTTLTANVVDLARHPSIWIASLWRNQMLVWLGVYAATAITTQLLVQTGQGSTPQTKSVRWMPVLLVAESTILLLFVCPEWDIDYSSETAHILTVAVGALVLLLPIRLLLPVLVPHESDERHGGRVLLTTSREWGALAIGVVLFGVTFLRQLQNFRPLPYVHPALISGLVGAILIAYAFLAEPLGFGSRES
jgi:hypothetical protein